MTENQWEKTMLDSYNKLYREDNFHRVWEGEISLRYKVPKYASIFAGHFKDKNPSILELGAGDGYLTKLIMEQLRYAKYVATEISDEGVKKLKEKGIRAIKMNAEKLDFKDNSFDIVCAFDVMHHVADPQKMVSEMIRVAKKDIFLIEANGLCAIRKIFEMTIPRYKMVGEKSYTPRKYASLFISKGIKNVYIKPFLAIFPFTPNILIKPSIWLSEIMERIPILKWQCSSVLISAGKPDKKSD